MRVRPARLAFLVTLIAGILAPSATLGAQSRDSALRWSLFGGSLAQPGDGFELPPSDLEIGGSGEFRLGGFPLPLRASVSFSKKAQPLTMDHKFGMISLDAIGRPVPRVLGVQLFFLGGVGLATRAPAVLIHQELFGDPATPVYRSFNVGRQTWTYLEGGLGLELGRAFVQARYQVPVASHGQRMAPISVGFRF